MRGIDGLLFSLKIGEFKTRDRFKVIRERLKADLRDMFYTQ